MEGGKNCCKFSTIGRKGDAVLQRALLVNYRGSTKRRAIEKVLEQSGVLEGRIRIRGAEKQGISEGIDCPADPFV